MVHKDNIIQIHGGCVNILSNLTLRNKPFVFNTASVGVRP